MCILPATMTSYNILYVFGDDTNFSAVCIPFLQGVCVILYGVCSFSCRASSDPDSAVREESL